MNLLNRMVLRNKFVALGAVLIAPLVLVGAIGINDINRWQDDMRTIDETKPPKVITLNAIDYDRRNVAAFAHNVYKFQNFGANEIGKRVGNLLKKRQDAFSDIDKMWEEFLETPVLNDKETQDIREKLLASYAKWREANLLIDKAMQEVVDNSDAARQRAIFQNFEKVMAQTKEASLLFENDLAALSKRVNNFCGCHQ
ncbi:MAG: Tar ligand binding domain-containing protein [Helicobacteraceae bacterium]|nr:Tar ligand binding domain-containing protein [Helicobacteraceae bacterium]